MKHQGQTMSETMSMVGVGLAFMRCSFLLVVTAICRGVDCESQEFDNISNRVSLHQYCVDLVSVFEARAVRGHQVNLFR